MEVVAKARLVRISPKKVRLVTKPITKMTPDKALKVLKLSKKKAAVIVSKLIKSALSNAQHNFGLETDKLIFKRIEVGPGPILKRWRAGARGRVKPILKRTSNLTVVLEGSELKKATELEAKISNLTDTKAKPEVKPETSVLKRSKRNGTKS